MSYTRRSRYYKSPSPYGRYERSVSRSISRSRSRSRSISVENPGNNLYVTGLSARVTRRDLEKHFSAEGEVEDIHLVVDPRTRESRGFAFVTMSSLEEAERCIKYLDGSVLDSRVITVEKSRRRRGRTPTPGRYLGLKTDRVRRRSPSYSPSYDKRRSDPFERDRSPSYSPYYRRRRSRSYSPYPSRERYYSRSRSPYWSRHRHDRSYSPHYSRYYSPDHQYYRRSRYRSVSRSVSPPRRGYSRSYLRSISPPVRRRRDYSLPRSRSPYSRSPSPIYRGSSRRRDYSRSTSPVPRRWRDYSLSRSLRRSPISGSVSRSVTPRSASPSS